MGAARSLRRTPSPLRLPQIARDCGRGGSAIDFAARLILPKRPLVERQPHVWGTAVDHRGHLSQVLGGGSLSSTRRNRAGRQGFFDPGAQHVGRREVTIPNIDIICRDTIQAANAEVDRLEARFAIRRRERNAQEREHSRQMAQHWRKTVLQKEKLELDRLKEQKLKEEEAALLCQQAVNKSLRKGHWTDVRNRLYGEGPRRRKYTYCPLAPALASPAESEGAEGLRPSNSCPHHEGDGGVALDPEPHLVEKEDNDTSSSAVFQKRKSRVARLSVRMPRGKLSADKRIDTLRKMQKQRERNERYIESKQQHDTWKQQFAELPEEERTMYTEVFQFNDSSGAGLTASQIWDTLVETGLCTIDGEDSEPVREICELAAVSKQPSLSRKGAVGCDLFRFAMDVVPAVRAVLMSQRRASLVQQVSMVKRGWSGKLNYEPVLDAVMELWPIEVETDAYNDLQVELTNQVRLSCSSFVEEEMDTEAFIHKVERLCESKQYHNHATLRRIQTSHDFDNELFEEFRLEVVPLDRVFRLWDTEEAGCITGSDCLQLVKELQVIDWTAPMCKQKQAAEIVKSHAFVDFKHFFFIMKEIHAVMETHIGEALKRAFQPFARLDETEAGQFVSTADLPQLFEDVEILPRTSKEQDAVERFIQDMDQKGQTRLNIQEVKRACQRAWGHIRLQHLIEDFEMAAAYGFAESDVKESKSAFTELDTDHSGKLDPTETKRAMSLLGVGFKREDHFLMAYQMLDQDGNGGLDFREFISLMKMIRDREGVFKCEHSAVTCLNELDKMDLLILTSIFEGDLDKVMYAADEEALKAKIGTLLEVDPKASFSSVLGVKTLDDLWTHAQWRSDFLKGSVE